VTTESWASSGDMPGARRLRSSLCLRLSTNAKSSAAITATATTTRIGVHLRHAPFEHVATHSLALDEVGFSRVRAGASERHETRR